MTTTAESHLAEAVEHYEASQTKAEIRRWMIGLMVLPKCSPQPNRTQGARHEH